MLKNKLKLLLLCATLTTGIPASGSATAPEFPAPEDSVVAVLPDGQAEVKAEGVNSTEVNTITESELTRKMLQAEKAKNAAENDEYGVAITIIAMLIVVGCLVVLSILFFGFGKISSALLSKKKRVAHGLTKDNLPDDHEDIDSGEAIAAIAAALSEHFGQGHDMEDTILTIRRMKRAYSPWNSKIYNLRVMPEHHPAKR